LTSVLLFFIPFLAQAADPLDLVINEIAWMGTKIEGIESKNWWRYEWLEFYNNTGNKISLSGWKIELYSNDLDWTLPLEGEILAKGYFLVVSSEKIFPEYNLNYSNLSGKFKNSGQKVLLKDGEGKIVDEVNCLSGWFAGNNETKRTMERKDQKISGLDFTNWQTSQNPGGTPKAGNSPGLISLEKNLKKEISEEKSSFIPKQNSRFLINFLIALLFSIFSASIILIFKRKIKKK